MRVQVMLTGAVVVGAVLAAAGGAGCSSQHKGTGLVATVHGEQVTVPVELNEYAIKMPDTIPTGDVTFNVWNNGREVHNLEIKGPGVSAKLANNLRPGETATLSLHLNPGTYRVTCPVDAHTALGMNRVLTVTAR